MGQTDACLSPRAGRVIILYHICFSHLTDQAFIWDQAAIWDIKIPDENVTNFASLSVNSLASLCKWSCCSGGKDLVNQHSRKLLMSAVTHGGVHLFRHRPDHFAGHALVACPFADHPFPHVYLKLLASLLPPSTRQPSPVADLLGQTLKLHFILSPISHVLDCVEEKSLGAA